MATNKNEEFAQVLFLVEEYCKNISKKIVKILAVRRPLKPIFIFPIVSLWKL